jgi:hypothetical protein
VPILVLGDPAQLPPVEGGGYYTNATPDHLLTEIHRQALDNPITALATRIRESQSVGLGLTRDDMTAASVRDAMQHDQVLCWSNKRRWAMISAMRQLLNRPKGEVVPGDRIMCLTNNKDRPTPMGSSAGRCRTRLSTPAPACAETGCWPRMPRPSRCTRPRGRNGKASMSSTRPRP